MPFQTAPFLPLTVSAAASSSSLVAPALDDPFEPFAPFATSSAGHYYDQRATRAHYPASDTSSLTPSTTTTADPPAPSSRSSNHSRRYTFARFPLLRKGSRELTRGPSFLKGISPTATPTDSPFFATGAPRASFSLARGPDHSPAREPNHHHHYYHHHQRETDVITEEEAQTSQADSSRADKPDKMHQTSSRLLRMTDDERPFTRVSLVLYLWGGGPLYSRKSQTSN